MPIVHRKAINDESKESCKDRVVRYAVGIPIFLGVYLVLMLFYVYPHWPLDLIGWAILVLAGIPASLCLEVIGEFVLSEESGQEISNNKFSIKRVVIALLVFAVIAGASILLWFAYGSSIRHHFR